MFGYKINLCFMHEVDEHSPFSIVILLMCSPTFLSKILDSVNNNIFRHKDFEAQALKKCVTLN